jgi:UDP-N-acetylglucosamine 2-epimerase (non-hydrolysing)
VLTINRKALLADKENLQRMLTVITEVAGDIPVIAPLRPSVSTQLSTLNSQLSTVNSLPYLEFGYLTSHAMGIITDSGNVAEEATFNHVPCITLNSYTEHIETVKQGTNELVGEDADQLRTALGKMIAGDWKTGSLPDRWDGRSAERIVQILMG